MSSGSPEAAPVTRIQGCVVRLVTRSQEAPVTGGEVGGEGGNPGGIDEQVTAGDFCESLYNIP